jgi:hypothetical protein
MPYWIETDPPVKLAIAPRPRGGDWLADDLRSYRRDGIDILVSLLTPIEEVELGLRNEPDACRESGIDFRSFPIPDRHTPQSPPQFRAFVLELHAQSLQGRSIAAHCRAGIGRSSLLIACLLIRYGIPPDDAFRRISLARGLQVPDTPEQIDWVRAFSSEFS